MPIPNSKEISVLRGYDMKPSGTIFIECVGCENREDFMDDDIDSISDTEATQKFNKKGWSVLPTVCPDCVKKLKKQLKLKKR